MSAGDSPAPWVALARIRRPQGRKGEVLAEILTDFPEKFAERRSLWLLPPGDANEAERTVTLRDHWLHKGAIVLHFEGVDSISAAEALIGCTVAIPREQRAALVEGEFYIADLAGCTLVDVAQSPGAEVGVIRDVDRSAGPVPLLIVARAGAEILVPFARSYLRRVDLAARRVEMELPEGLTSLNAETD